MVNQISPDQLQNELLVLSHHIDDVIKAVKTKDHRSALLGLTDCREIIDRIANFLPPNKASEIERMAESLKEIKNEVLYF